jgi:phosphoglycerate dehydrogenase-like enzyme
MTTTLITAFPSQFDSRELAARLREAGSQVELLYPATTPTEAETVALLKGVSAFIAGNEPVTERVLETASDLKIIARTGVGVDNIDLEAAHARGIRVTITPGLTSNAVADLAIGLLLCVARRICVNDKWIREGRWDRTIGADLAGKTLGIIGMGAIGKLAAQRALAFDLRVVAFDSVEDHTFAKAHRISFVRREELFQSSDFVSLHMPLTPETRGSIGERELRLMKPTAYLINTARGALVDEQALDRALREGWIAGAGLDVFAQEPPLRSPLLDLDNVVMTAHVGAWTEGTWAAMAGQAVTEVIRALQGLPALNAV